MNDNIEVRIGLWIIGVLCGMWLGIGIESCADRTYMDGQVDALTGKIKYELVTHPDSTKTWEAVK